MKRNKDYLLLWLASRYFPHGYISNVKEQIDYWQFVESTLEEPRGILDKLVYRWVAKQVGRVLSALRALDAVGVAYYGTLESEVTMEVGYVEHS